jgi:hypothetical protein
VGHDRTVAVGQWPLNRAKLLGAAGTAGDG